MANSSKRAKPVIIPAPTPADTQQTFSMPISRIGLSPHEVYADYRIVTHILADHLLSVPLTCTLASPFDRLATIQQVSPWLENAELSSRTSIRPLIDMYKNEGVEGYFVGNLTGILQDSVFKLSDALIEEVLNEYSFGSFYSFVAANVLARIISYPLLTIRRRLQILTGPNQERSIIATTKDIIQHKGYIGLWDGAFWKIAADSVQLALQYGIMKLLLGYSPDLSKPKNNELFSFAFGFVLASCVVVPMRTISKCQEVSNTPTSAQDIYNTCGTNGLLLNGLLSTALASCFSVVGLISSSYIMHYFID